MSRCDCGVIGAAEDHDSYCSWHPSQRQANQIEELEDTIADLRAAVDDACWDRDIYRAALEKIAKQFAGGNSHEIAQEALASTTAEVFSPDE